MRGCADQEDDALQTWELLNLSPFSEIPKFAEMSGLSFTLFSKMSSSFPRIHRSLHPLLEQSIPFILRTSRNARCLERFLPKVRQHSVTRECCTCKSLPPFFSEIVINQGLGLSFCLFVFGIILSHYLYPWADCNIILLYHYFCHYNTTKAHNFFCYW